MMLLAAWSSVNASCTFGFVRSRHLYFSHIGVVPFPSLPWQRAHFFAHISAPSAMAVPVRLRRKATKATPIRTFFIVTPPFFSALKKQSFSPRFNPLHHSLLADS